MASAKEYPDCQKAEPDNADRSDPRAAVAGIGNRVERHPDRDGAQTAGKVEQVIGERQAHRHPEHGDRVLAAEEERGRTREQQAIPERPGCLGAGEEGRPDDAPCRDRHRQGGLDE